jgi:hypothetical protein
VGHGISEPGGVALAGAPTKPATALLSAIRPLLPRQLWANGLVCPLLRHAAGLFICLTLSGWRWTVAGPTDGEWPAS